LICRLWNFKIWRISFNSKVLNSQRSGILGNGCMSMLIYELSHFYFGGFLLKGVSWKENRDFGEKNKEIRCRSWRKFEVGLKFRYVILSLSMKIYNYVTCNLNLTAACSVCEICMSCNLEFKYHCSMCHLVLVWLID